MRVTHPKSCYALIIRSLELRYSYGNFHKRKSILPENILRPEKVEKVVNRATDKVHDKCATRKSFASSLHGNGNKISCGTSDEAAATNEKSVPYDFRYGYSSSGCWPSWAFHMHSVIFISVKTAVNEDSSGEHA